MRHHLEDLELVEVVDFKLDPKEFGIKDVNTQLKYIGKKVPYRGEMRLSTDSNETSNPTGDPNHLQIEVFTFWERRSTWWTIGAGLAGLSIGLMIGKSR